MKNNKKTEEKFGKSTIRLGLINKHPKCREEKLKQRRKKSLENNKKRLTILLMQ